eukprot:CAMPEP_0170625482 /NCGR_PEP_ID=MMETSP0224-20130122/30781_1 /TAXON_ID=285029 /ORGANISM="Togula jolla, Strain CCCM 725" /LENGTH=170 /DNA_ID=CAMNT_0010952057 /DNA_START=192 /DNA_END=703 /DNA_ORIENTATION=+
MPGTPSTAAALGPEDHSVSQLQPSSVLLRQSGSRRHDRRRPAGTWDHDLLSGGGTNTASETPRKEPQLKPLQSLPIACDGRPVLQAVAAENRNRKAKREHQLICQEARSLSQLHDGTISRSKELEECATDSHEKSRTNNGRCANSSRKARRPQQPCPDLQNASAALGTLE